MIWFTSDHHFYHTNIIRYCKRPFQDVETMNAVMVQRWNSVVSPLDTVYYLGDFALAHRAVTVFLPALYGKKHLIAGNHDHVHPAHHKNKPEKASRARKIYSEAGFESVCLQLEVELAGEPVLLHHMPYTGDHERERYTEYRPKDTGRWLLHGHVHEKWKTLGKQINVGVDVWDFYPVPLSEIERIIYARAESRED